MRQSDVHLILTLYLKEKFFIDAKSILGVLSLDVEEPLELKYDGYDEDFESVIAGLAC